MDTVGRNQKRIEEYIRNQLQEDIAADQMTLKEYIDPFTGLYAVRDILINHTPHDMKGKDVST